MNKKGFTLIELLAVIVILAIIALIAIPIVLNIISDVNKNSTEISMKNIDKAASLYYQENYNNENIIFECNNNKCKFGNHELDLTGKSPESGKILIDKKGNITYEDIVLNGFNCYKEHKKFVCDTKKIRKTYNESKIVINSESEYNLFDYNIYGNSVQNETTSQYESVGDKTVNLFDLNAMLEKFENKDGEVVKNYFVVSMQFKPNTQYYMKTNGERSGDSFLISTVKAVNTVYNSAISVSTNWASERSVTTDETGLLYFGAINSNIEDMKTQFELAKVQIVEGISSKEYEPYNKYKIQVNVKGNNLFNNKEIYIRYSDDEVIIEDNKLILNTPSRGGTKWIWSYIPVKNNQTYTIYCKASASQGQTATRYKFVTEKTMQYSSDTILTNLIAITKDSFTITSNLDGYLLLTWMLPIAESTLTLENLKVEEGDIATNYEPYYNKTTNIYLEEPLRKVGDKADYIDFKNQKVVRCIEEDSLGKLKVLSVPKEEKIELPEILLRAGTNNIEIETSIKPSKVDLEYYKH